MDNFIIMKIDESLEELEHVQLDLWLTQSFFSFEQIVECVIGAEFQQDVHVEIVLEGMLEFYDIVVMQCFVDLNLADQLRYFYALPSASIEASSGCTSE